MSVGRIARVAPRGSAWSAANVPGQMANVADSVRFKVMMETVATARERRQMTRPNDVLGVHGGEGQLEALGNSEH